jgi:hypothetical protein
LFIFWKIQINSNENSKRNTILFNIFTLPVKRYLAKIRLAYSRLSQTRVVVLGNCFGRYNQLPVLNNNGQILLLHASMLKLHWRVHRLNIKCNQLCHVNIWDGITRLGAPIHWGFPPWSCCARLFLSHIFRRNLIVVFSVWSDPINEVTLER